ncbi:hypothetical protein I5G67_gp077 [Mycobacterium phage Aminay]|uniref:Uncharacterized protein n=1 Tax=Mycobacterium phage Aminay TaxID=2250291 RepID=A0A345KV61_9CAUD|nr:hypothetical protein I5G67_gp077 [Mycobacterium phage Aminay]AXH46913.1 hypothetical protein SEA_AMINAY_77 [Mycobacterium phage Aminay]
MIDYTTSEFAAALLDLIELRKDTDKAFATYQRVMPVNVNERTEERLKFDRWQILDRRTRQAREALLASGIVEPVHSDAGTRQRHRVSELLKAAVSHQAAKAANDLLTSLQWKAHKAAEAAAAV